MSTSTAVATVTRNPLTATVPRNPGDRGEAEPVPSAASVAAARSFLSGFLPYSYGQRSAVGVVAVTGALRGRLLSAPPVVPPAVAHLHARLIRLFGLPSYQPGVSYVSAQVTDGKSDYSLLLTVQRAGRGWQVANVR